MGIENPSILIVDDEHGLRSLLRLSFSAAGYDVHAAADVPEAMGMCGPSPSMLCLRMCGCQG